MICDWHDFTEDRAPAALERLLALKEANQRFRATLFAIPMAGSQEFWHRFGQEHGDWLELAVHGWKHGDPPTDGGECKNWSRDEMAACIARTARLPFAHGFCAPGWQISDGCYQVLLEEGWWVSDQSYNDHRRPRGLRVHRLGDGDHWHGHCQNVCGNGLEETFDEVYARVVAASSFELVSEMAIPW